MQDKYKLHIYVRSVIKRYPSNKCYITLICGFIEVVNNNNTNFNKDKELTHVAFSLLCKAYIRYEIQTQMQKNESTFSVNSPCHSEGIRRLRTHCSAILKLRRFTVKNGVMLDYLIFLIPENDSKINNSTIQVTYKINLFGFLFLN